MGSQMGSEGSSLRSVVQSMVSEKSGSSDRPWDTGSRTAVVEGFVVSGGGANPPCSRDCNRSSNTAKSVDDDN